jgi:hypothetical protein
LITVLSKGADCNTDKYLVVENVRERLLVSKRAAQKYDMEIFSLKKLNDVEVMQNLDDSRDKNMAWEKQYTEYSYSTNEILSQNEWKQHKSWFDKRSKFVDKRKQANLAGTSTSCHYNSTTFV